MYYSHFYDKYYHIWIGFEWIHFGPSQISADHISCRSSTITPHWWRAQSLHTYAISSSLIHCYRTPIWSVVSTATLSTGKRASEAVRGGQNLMALHFTGSRTSMALQSPTTSMHFNSWTTPQRVRWSSSRTSCLHSVNPTNSGNYNPLLPVATSFITHHSFLFRKSTNLYNRRHSKILTTLTSYFTSCYVLNWSQYFPDTPLRYPPSFDGRIVVYPTERAIRDYFSWRQADSGSISNDRFAETEYSCLSA